MWFSNSYEDLSWKKKSSLNFFFFFFMFMGQYICCRNFLHAEVSRFCWNLILIKQKLSLKFQLNNFPKFLFLKTVPKIISGRISGNNDKSNGKIQNKHTHTHASSPCKPQAHWGRWAILIKTNVSTRLLQESRECVFKCNLHPLNQTRYFKPYLPLIITVVHTHTHTP